MEESNNIGKEYMQEILAIIDGFVNWEKEVPYSKFDNKVKEELFDKFYDTIAETLMNSLDSRDDNDPSFKDICFLNKTLLDLIDEYKEEFLSSYEVGRKKVGDILDEKLQSYIILGDTEGEKKEDIMSLIDKALDEGDMETVEKLSKKL